MTVLSYRTGFGYDVHAFQEGDHLVLGGVKIPHRFAFAAHSDGDVLLHAICDALFGAAGLGDIGHHFPDTDPAYKGIDSRELLRSCRRAVSASGYRVGNVDATIAAQAPKLRPHIPAMQVNIAADLDVLETQINIKATTTERLGFVGREEGIAAYATALLVAIDG